MAAVYDEVEIEDMDWNETERAFYYACPCGDKFVMSLVRPAFPLPWQRSAIAFEGASSPCRVFELGHRADQPPPPLPRLPPPPARLQEDLLSGEDIARCPSCSLRIRVICDPEVLEAEYGAADAVGAAGAPEAVAAC
jgi:hypothetical protein